MNRSTQSAHAMGRPRGGVHPTRREAIGVFAAAAALLPSSAATHPNLPPALSEICLEAVASPFRARLGEAATGGRRIEELTDALLTRLGPEAGSDWHAALCDSARRDIARGDTPEVLGCPLVRTEADLLAMGSLLRRAASRV